MTRVIINGYLGKLGRSICELIESGEGGDCHVAAGIDIADNTKGAYFPTYKDISECDMPADVIIDCSLPDVTLKALEYACAKNTPLLICTTALSPELLVKIDEASSKIAVFRSANMALGVNMVQNLLQKASKLLFDSGFDVEIIEKHHNQKLDAPSGTAMMFADTINSAVGGNLEYVYGRSPEKKAAREKAELGMHAVRGGTITGEHSIIFAGKDETIEISHIAFSRKVFAVGAVRAAMFLAGKPAGKYDMNAMLNEE